MKEIIGISIQSGVLTALTSFVCILENNNPVAGEMVRMKAERKAVSSDGYLFELMMLSKSDW